MVIRSKGAETASTPNSTATYVAESQSAHLVRIAGRLAAIGCLALAVLCSSGCSVISGIRKSFDQSECIDDFMIGYRNKVMAEKAWICHKHRFGTRCNLPEFKDGFVSGYIDVASGGYGCTPAIAPPAYWGWRYQSAQGQHGVNAWFEGFPHGAQVAEKDGIGHWKSNIAKGVTPQAEMQVYAPLDGGGDGVTNPLYSEPEYQPTPVPELEPSKLDDLPGTEANPFEDDPQPSEAGPLFNSAFREVPVEEVESLEEGPALVPQLEVARNEEATFATNSEDPLELETAPESAAVIIDDIFGSSTPISDSDFSDSDPDALPFSFE